MNPPPLPARRAAPRVEPIAPEIDLEAHRVTDAEQVRSEFEALAADTAPLTAYPQGTDAFCLCRIRSVGPQPHRMTLEALSTQAPTNGHTLFVATRPGAKLQFSLDAEWSADEGRQACLHADLPAELVRLQRREFHRIEAPLGHSYTAEFMLDGQPRQLFVSDVSLGGVGLRGSPREIGSLRVGTRLRRVHIELAQGQTLLADLEVRLCRPFRSYLLGEQVHVGCRFVDMTAPLHAVLDRAIDALRR